MIENATQESDAPQGVSFQPNIYQCILERLPQDKQARILDAGGGQGYFAKLARDNGYTNTEVGDLLIENFKLPEVPFHEIDLNAPIPIEDDTFDCVVSIEVVEHIEHHENYFKELLRILKPGGKLVVSTPNVQSIASRIHYLLYGHSDAARRPFPPEMPSYRTHVNNINLQAILYYLGRYGGDIERVSTNRYRASALGFSFLWPVFWIAARLRASRKKFRNRSHLYKPFVQYSLSPAVLFGRLLIVEATKKAAAESA